MKNHLKTIMKKQGVTAWTLEKTTGIPRRTLVRYVKNERLPRINDAFIISKTLNVEVFKIWEFENIDIFHRKNGNLARLGTK